ncbi:MAG: RluA family pseudouridine synthase [Clostridia bacterium]|nr:RluA family pseudouridine synthase [Clostridia bacterium]
MKKLTATDITPVRVDVFLAEKTGYTRSRVKKACDDGLVKVNGKSVKSNKTVKAGDTIEMEDLPITETNIAPENIPINIVYEDKDVAVIDKPQGMTVHAGHGVKWGTLVNALLYRLDSLSGINGVIRPGIVHRIDKNTSGLLVVAKNDNAHLKLSKQLQDKTCRRIYCALLEGNLKEDRGTVDTFIARDPKDRTKMTVSDRGRRAVTDYEVIKRYDGYTLCRFSLRTGRTHQIRVHAKFLGHPVVGDKEYGYKNQKFKLNGQLLHAEKLIFTHPSTNKVVEFTSPLPDHFTEVLGKLKEKQD